MLGKLCCGLCVVVYIVWFIVLVLFYVVVFYDCFGVFVGVG